MNTMKLFEACVFIGICVVFYWHVYRHIRIERIQDFKKRQADLRHSFRFDVKEMIAEEMRRLRCVDSRSCTKGVTTGTRKLAVFCRKMREMAAYFDETIVFSVELDGERNCLEMRVDDTIYYVLVVCEMKPGKSRLFRTVKSMEHRLQLRRGPSTLYENKDVRLVFKMMVRSLLQDLRCKQPFKEELLADCLACKE